MIDLTGKTALVTGAGRGIGAGITAKLASLGAAVALVDKDPESVRQHADHLVSQGFEAAAHAGDVLDKAFLSRTAHECIESHGAIDILVNNAGIIRDNYVENISEQDWDAVLGVNLKGAFLCTQAIVPHMKKHQGGKIVNIVSKAWLGTAGQSNYSASKGGLVSLTRTLALELAAWQINVNGVAPGLIDSPMTQNLSDKLMKRLLKSQPTGRMGTIDDVASAVCFLASDNAGFITGQILHVDGGKSCGLVTL